MADTDLGREGHWGRPLLLLQPLVDEVEIAVHARHLLVAEVISARVVWGQKLAVDRQRVTCHEACFLIIIYLSQINTRQTSFESCVDSKRKSRDCSAQ